MLDQHHGDVIAFLGVGNVEDRLAARLHPHRLIVEHPVGDVVIAFLRQDIGRLPSLGQAGPQPAARALAGAPEQGLSAALRPAFDKALAEYVAVQTYNADRPEGRMNLGNLYLQRRDVGAAIAEYRKAIELDPTFVAAYVNLADLYRAGGADGEAEPESVLIEFARAHCPRAGHVVFQHAGDL
jgi:tetratricopeptide (TPR) repeat protein